MYELSNFYATLHLLTGRLLYSNYFAWKFFFFFRSFQVYLVCCVFAEKLSPRSVYYRYFYLYGNVRTHELYSARVRWTGVCALSRHYFLWYTDTVLYCWCTYSNWPNEKMFLLIVLLVGRYRYYVMGIAQHTVHYFAGTSTYWGLYMYLLCIQTDTYL